MVAEVAAKLVSAAARYGVPADLVLSVARAESGGVQSAVSPAGAIGVMQLMPATAAGLGVNPYNESENIDGGVRYLRSMYDRYGSWSDALAAYNAGPGTLDRVLAGVRSLPAETVAYVRKILGVEPAPVAEPVWSERPEVAAAGVSSSGWDAGAFWSEFVAAAGPQESSPWLLAAAAAGAAAGIWLVVTG